eukprot:scaffold7375_cov268-Pinguiococcus_pyrenoidosus.AAC.6
MSVRLLPIALEKQLEEYRQLLVVDIQRRLESLPIFPRLLKEEVGSSIGVRHGLRPRNIAHRVHEEPQHPDRHLCDVLAADQLVGEAAHHVLAVALLVVTHEEVVLVDGAVAPLQLMVLASNHVAAFRARSPHPRLPTVPDEVDGTALASVAAPSTLR